MQNNENLETLIDKLHMEDLNNEKHPSIFDENENYDMLIVRLPVIEDDLKVESMGFIFTQTQSYLYNKEGHIFEKLSSRFDGPYKIIDEKTDKVIKAFVKYQDTVAEMEECLYADKIEKHFMKKWLGLKLTISRLERILMKAESTLDEFTSYHMQSEGFPQNKYVDLHEHIERTMRTATLQLLKLDDLYSFYSANSNEKMNRIVYILTIISGIFLPLNLVVGFFGMNTTGLPFTQGETGTFNVVAIMFSLGILTSIGVYKWYKKS